MEVALQLSLLTVSVCLGAVALVRRAAGSRSEAPTRIDVGPVSTSWLVEHQARSRPE